MPDRQSIVSQLQVMVEEKELAAEIHSRILEVQVDQQVHLPHMFSIRLYDPGMKLVDGGPFNLAALVTIKAMTADNKQVTLITGEVTALEPDFGEGMIAELVVRGYDRSHRLYRSHNSKTYLNVKDSDLAAEFAKKAKLTAKVDATATVYEHLYQCNQSDLHFLQQRAWRIGYECYVEGKYLYFRKPQLKQAAVKIAWGEELLAYRPRLTIAEQAKETVVRGWDVQRKAPVIGRAEAGNLYPEIKQQSNGSQAAEAFGKSRLVIVDQEVVSQAEADILAAARQNELSGAYIEADGEAFRRPDIQAGCQLAIAGLGQRFSGTYLVTRATHVYTSGGLHTHFSVTGARTGLLHAQLQRSAPVQRWPGAVTGIVTNTDDPKGWGRVKVKYPWLSEEEESNWARVAAAGAGPTCGLAVVPAIDDEVLVVFQHGDFDQPVVVGGLWNGKDRLPAAVTGAATGEKPLVRSWRSRTGHHITLHDNAANKLEIATSHGHALTLDDAGKKITLRSAGGLEIVLDDSGKIVVSSSGSVEVTAGSELILKGMSVKVEASASLSVQAGGAVSIKGASVSLN